MKVKINQPVTKFQRKISFVLFRRVSSWDNEQGLQRVAMFVTTTVFWLIFTKLRQYLKLGCRLLKKKFKFAAIKAYEHRNESL